MPSAVKHDQRWTGETQRVGLSTAANVRINDHQSRIPWQGLPRLAVHPRRLSLRELVGPVCMVSLDETCIPIGDRTHPVTAVRELDGTVLQLEVTHDNFDRRLGWYCWQPEGTVAPDA